MKFLTIPFLLLIKLYQLFVSPLFPAACRFDPTCSHYAIDAIRRHGFTGIWFAIKRIGRCHPWGRVGYDPVPTSTPHIHD
jgi:putative membrane protein insertion efficiency factor